MTYEEIVSQVREGGIVDTVRRKIVADSPLIRFGLQLDIGLGVSTPLEPVIVIHRQLSLYMRQEG